MKLLSACQLAKQKLTFWPRLLFSKGKVRVTSYTKFALIG